MDALAWHHFRVLVGLFLLGASFQALPALGLSSLPSASPSLEDVLRTLKVDATPSDYVVIIDRSGSMEPYLPTVRRALSSLAGALHPNDHLSLITFGDGPTLHWSEPVGSDPGKVVGQLPERVEGNASDIGAALEVAVDELSRPDAAPAATILMLTDGKHSAGTNSRYPHGAGPGWTTLAQRVGRLTGAHSFEVMALGLTPNSDAALMRQVFPAALVLAPPHDQLGGYFRRLAELARIAKAKAALRQDLTAGVRVFWPRDLGAIDVSKDKHEIVIKLTSTAGHMPLTLTDMHIEADGYGTLSPPSGTTIDLPAGRTEQITATLSWAKPDGFKIDRDAIREQGTLALTATISSPWTQVIEDPNALDLEVNLALTGQRAEFAIVGSHGLGWGKFGAFVALGILVLVILLRLLVRRRPKLSGTLAAMVSGQSPAQVALSGRVVSIGRARGSRLDLPGRGKVWGRRIPRDGRAGSSIELIVEYSSNGGRPKTGRIKANASAVIEDATFTFHP